MAQRITKLKAEKISCSICLDLLKDPMTIPCGHSYCMKCIKNHWDGEDDLRRIYSCPQCRKTFITRPALQKNFVLSALVEDLKRADLTPVDDCHAGPEDVACDVCTESKLKAVKSCLVCLASYCKGHLKPHYNAPPLKKHKLVDPSKKLQENICSNHDEAMKIFCRTDQQCICYLCLMDEHKGHETVPAAAERTEKQKELQERRQQIQRRIQDQEKDADRLQQEMEAVRCSADKAVKYNETIYRVLLNIVSQRRHELDRDIRCKEETEVSRIRKIQEKLEQEITELKLKDAELEKILQTEDLNQFLQNYPSLPALSEATHSSSINIPPQRYFDNVTAAVSEFKKKVDGITRDQWTNVLLSITERDVTEPGSEPPTRAELLKYSQEITLVPNMAQKNVMFSQGNRKVTVPPQSNVANAAEIKLLLSKESLTGRCYWEVKWKGGGGISVGVSYNTSSFGFLFKPKEASFWSLHCNTSFCTFSHNDVKTRVFGPVSSRIGVYLDYKAGILCFYSISDTVTLIHRAKATFIEPLHAGIYLHTGGSAEFVKLKQS
ncbi:tripartite motif-containing protein 16-like [Cyprinodon tularosa]|uniref:tripartite motif-containing protein 16-like n=1 Tax=Cyprinodon tularosa TaxID=77115 RepID=UPI0018E1F987|nr:tripartite motif-containing protein 16-like [Cyprinodon tularosa]